MAPGRYELNRQASHTPHSFCDHSSTSNHSLPINILHFGAVLSFHQAARQVLKLQRLETHVQLSNKACLSWSIHARHPFQLSDDTSIGHHSVFRKLTVQKSALTRLRLQDSRRRPCRLTQNCLCDKALQVPSSIKPTTQMACGTSLQRKTARFSRSSNDVPLSSVHILSTYRISPRLKAKLGEAPRCVHQQQASKTEASYPSLFLCHRINRLVLLRRLS